MSQEIQAVNQQFTVEILTADAQEKIAPALAEAITGWDRELNEDEDDEQSDTDFLVGDDDGSSDDSDESDEGEEPDGSDYDVSDSLLNLVTGVTPAVMNDIKVIQAMDADERLLVRINYGAGTLVRQFTISPDLGVLLSSGDKSEAPLLITVVADVFDSETLF
jgi:hypothetical protein